MGLTTSMYELLEPTPEVLSESGKYIGTSLDSISTYEVGSEEGESIQDKFKFKRQDDHLTWKGMLGNHGLKEDEALFNSWGWNDDLNSVSYCFTLIKHELFSAYQYLDSKWNKYYSTWREFKISPEYLGFLQYLPILRKYGWRKNFHWYSSGNGKYSFNLVKAKAFVGERVTSHIIKTVTHKVEATYVVGKEILWVGKAANSSFYSTNRYDGLISTKSEVIHMLDNHFMNNVDEYNIKMVERIRNEFIEGKHFVINC